MLFNCFNTLSAEPIIITHNHKRELLIDTYFSWIVTVVWKKQTQTFINVKAMQAMDNYLLYVCPDYSY